MKVKSESLISDPVVLDDDFTFEAIELLNTVNFAIEVVTSDTGTGSFKLQASCSDPAKNYPTQGEPINIPDDEWVDIANSSQAITGGDKVMWNYQNAGFNYVRVVYTHASGDVGVDYLRINIKGV